ncbi:MAG: DUF47 domain-containing protein [Planctomycetes bacterium]|nr:DUF47 domain-containing protein [Planctomycetota bacterium]
MLFGSKDKHFFDLFERAAENMVRTAELFKEMLTEFDRRQEILGAIREAEHRGDAITHETITRLDQTFITPLDREDIHHLIAETDEVVDLLDCAAQRIVLYKVSRPTEDYVKQAQIALETARMLAEAIRALRTLKKPEQLSDLLIRIHGWENKGDELYHAMLARLFEDYRHDPIFVIQWKELYELVESAIDACETVAHVIRSIMVKNA